MSNMKFEEFKISEEILKAIKNLEYKKPSDVQAAVIPIALEGRDIIVKSQTGSGKTAAFAIPLCESADVGETEPQALVLTPTRELALQVSQDITNIGRYKKIRAIAVFGKQPIETQKKQLKQRVHVVVGTPGRTLDHIERGTINLEKIKYLILDEADEMLSMGFIEQVEEVIKAVPKNRVTMLFSATIPESIEAICKQYMVNPVKVEINPEKLTVEKIDQICYEVDEDKKFSLLKRLLYIENPDSCIVFCRTKENVDEITVQMKNRHYSCIKIHGGMIQNDRLDAMERFRKGEFRFLVATDVAARGIDVENITHIINYDLPLERGNYVHRIGRTGRAGKKGKAITFVTHNENRFLKAIEQYIGMEIPKGSIPTKEDSEPFRVAFYEKHDAKPIIKKTKLSNFNSDIMKMYISAGKKKKIRTLDIVGTICNIDGVSSDDIGIIDIQDSFSHVDIMNGKGDLVLKSLKNGTIKGKTIRVEKANK
ncbi:DEAD/DEAH box helicase [Clostridium estertheticum]|uniref:DEAD/DEAH box helicase n=1 Tax=Clostridium estertheticum TaxID=238834 RepID=UPI001C7D0698|nr:DEAD/DEAH box helicase [Clostridium estertheticum]MBX4266980.1 DEAD/DEAH box helicase [Clostridium estertheticum]WLC89812.1 DEAD/DEAH box helicase [Clostridium estertheticum]